ncbi:D-alanyl-D-alanine carboxypeptidase/D-alanyl-D-alanine-endopeptidase [Acidothermus cellulolyticus 11B]|uniref:D-alanyl-D-alanine carboxypeptidase/D-alanyl-D-alanine-endopeptidase n=1 Tax=Acidothermus cellulolyticus (strain ATCC 43068 / DSM 8971 / 11B) TaxID=351607 RepID=A0LRB4_ACIC1|nr:D-alanyl-D-alanine carboxypeptidase/D-alanyl-D-alanine-endopeptidase [Acidothermus cellulolyticus]ABK51974.1 D-alanyl-D-alanine carboxypeptidase/D-alanyl-D-alanine-endopeptidase [Acidothermus cellulolyticus 11B]
MAAGRRRRAQRRRYGIPTVAVLLAGAAGLFWLTSHRSTPADTAPPPASPPPVSNAAPTDSPAATTAQPPEPVRSSGNELPRDAPIPDPSALRAHLAAALGVLAGDDAALVVTDPATGRVLLDDGGNRRMPPASTLKIATAVAALAALDPQTRFATSVVLHGDRVVLVGGGDPTLAAPAPAAGGSSSGPPMPSQRLGSSLRPAQLADLADRTASELRALGRQRVSLGYDASLFVGPATAAGWQSSYIAEGDVAPVSALEVNEGRVDPARDARSPAPGASAAASFARLLAAAGIVVEGAPVVTAAAPADRVLAVVQSPTLADLVRQMLTVSDNDLAEAIARQVAIARGLPASFAGATQAIRDTLNDLGIDTSGLTISDASGLSTLDRLQPRMLTALLRLVLTNDRFSAVREGLPVAGLTGTLASRFTAPAAAPGVGVVHAKTGTLATVVTLAGYTTDYDGRVLAFAVLADAVPRSQIRAAESAVDALVGALVTCGCAR